MSEITKMQKAGMTSEGLTRGVAMSLMVLGTVVISFGGLLIRSMQEADAWQIALYRSLALFGMISMVLLWRYGRAMPQRVVAVGRQGIWAGLCMAGATICFLQSITTTTVANTLFMLSAVPFITAALGRALLGETLKPATLGAMCLAAVGVAVMLAGGLGAGSLYGNVTGLMTAVFFSGYAILVRRNRVLDMLPLLLVSSGVVSLIALALRWNDLVIPLHDLVLCIIIGAVLSGGANALFIHCSKQLSAAELSLFTLLEIALGPLWVWFVIHETPSTATLLGGTIVISAVLARTILSLRRQPRAPL